jgi:tetratricopeptide (TPR) repeat protein
MLYTDAREGDKAVQQSKRVLEMDPAFTGAYLFVARGDELQGKWPEAIAAYEQARDSYGAQYLAGVAHAWAASGNPRQAEAAFAKLKEFSKQNYVSPLMFAAYYAALGGGTICERIPDSARWNGASGSEAARARAAKKGSSEEIVGAFGLGQLAK